jgi:hypothetical protein
MDRLLRARLEVNVFVTTIETEDGMVAHMSPPAALSNDVGQFAPNDLSSEPHEPDDPASSV